LSTDCALEIGRWSKREVTDIKIMENRRRHFSSSSLWNFSHMIAKISLFSNIFYPGSPSPCFFSPIRRGLDENEEEPKDVLLEKEHQSRLF
jgi:hypothetical protein